jgi:hypothetical protein
MEPWEIKTDFKRDVDSKKTFIIFCEDGAVEPTYFELFKTPKVHVSTIGECSQHHAQVDFATEYFRKNDLIELNEFGKEILKIDDGAQVWCVFDRDKNDGDKKDTAFNDSIINANSKGIQTAWSNDDFELWVLLHFEDVDPNIVEYKNRKYYYSRLTDILKTLAPQEKIFNNPRFDYYLTMKSKRRFLQITYQFMKGNLNIAIERATRLEEFHSRTIKPTHLHCPCTMVHHLVNELIAANTI